MASLACLGAIIDLSWSYIGRVFLCGNSGSLSSTGKTFERPFPKRRTASGLKPKENNTTIFSCPIRSYLQRKTSEQSTVSGVCQMKRFGNSA